MSEQGGREVDGHPAEEIDDVVHQRHRLGVLVVLAEARRADFSYLRSVLELTDGNLGRHLQVLEAAGYVALEKVIDDGRPRTWVTLTRRGRAALRHELDTMQRLIERVQGG
jgi:DNA-binding MarR family transcriptional regulator